MLKRERMKAVPCLTRLMCLTFLALIGFSALASGCTGKAKEDFASIPENTPQDILFRVTDIPGSSEAKVGIRGSQPPLSWDRSLFLTSNDDLYEIKVTFEADPAGVEYKYVIDNADPIIWEGIDNRRVPTSANKLNDVWNVSQQDAEKADRLLRPDELEADLALIKTAVFEIHPGTFRYLDQDELEVAFSALERDFATPLTQKQAYFALSKFLSKLQCDHTYANFYNQSRSVRAQILDGRDKLPFGLIWLGDRLVISKSMSSTVDIQAGSEIISINGMKASEIAEQLFPLIPADGPALAPRQAEAGIQGYSFQLEAFDVFQPFIIPPTNGSYEIEVLQPGAVSAERLSVAAVTRQERSNAFTRQSSTWPTKPDHLWTISEINADTVLLKIGTFVTWRFDVPWKDRLDEAFETIGQQGYSNLILDLRGNTGGADAPANYLFERIVSDECRVPSFEERSRYKSFPATLASVSNSWNDSWKTLPVQTALPGGYYQLPLDDDWIIRPNTEAFQGNVVVLIDGHNASGGFYLARAAKTCGITLIGTPTGGSQSGISGGQIVFVRLPGTGLEFDLPVVGTFGPEGAPSVGIRPDIQTQEDFSDIAAGNDATLDAALTYFEEL